MEKYDKQKLIAMQNRSRELHGAYLRISDDRQHYMAEARNCKNMLIKADDQAKRNNRRQVVTGKKTVKATFTPLHIMPLDEVLDSFEGHPTQPYINTATLKEYIRILEEYNRLEEHWQDLSIRVTESIREVDQCMDFLRSKGFSDNNLPMK